jgi:hypothetical protein
MLLPGFIPEALGYLYTIRDIWPSYTITALEKFV